MGWSFYNSSGQLLTAPASTSTADLATTVTVTDNEAVNENNVLTFVADAAATGGNVGLESDGDLHYNPSTGLLTATGLTLTGNLTVNGTTTTIDTATLAVEDPLIILASGNDAADALDIGLYGLYDTSGSTDLYSGMFRDASDSGKWKLFKDLQAVPTTTVNTSGTGYAVGTLVANLEGNVTGNTSGTAATVTTAAQTAITSVGTLSALGVSGTVTAGGFTIGSAAIDETELEILDGATVTTTELNLIDGGTARGTNAVATGDGILINDAGTMHMTNVDTVSTYFASHSVGGGNIVTTGALNSGSITSGFGTIDIGSSTLGSGNITSSGSGATSITSTSTSANGILLHANGGTSETIKVHSDQGTGVDSINLLSDAGGITLAVPDGKSILLHGATVFNDEVTITYDATDTVVDCTKGNKFDLTFGSGNITDLYLHPPDGPANIMLRLIQDASGGSRVVTNWYKNGGSVGSPSGTTKVHFAGGTKPTLSTAVNSVDVFAFYYDGTNWHGMVSLDSKAYS